MHLVPKGTLNHGDTPAALRPRVPPCLSAQVATRALMDQLPCSKLFDPFSGHSTVMSVVLDVEAEEAPAQGPLDLQLLLPLGDSPAAGSGSSNSSGGDGGRGGASSELLLAPGATAELGVSVFDAQVGCSSGAMRNMPQVGCSSSGMRSMPQPGQPEDYPAVQSHDLLPLCLPDAVSHAQGFGGVRVLTSQILTWSHAQNPAQNPAQPTTTAKITFAWSQTQRKTYNNDKITFAWSQTQRLVPLNCLQLQLQLLLPGYRSR